MGNSQAGEEEREKSSEKTPQTSAPLVLELGTEETRGCLSLPEPSKSRSRTLLKEAPELGEGTDTQRRAGPSSPGQNTASPLPPGSGAPDRLGSSPTLQLGVVNCSHCPEGTNEALGSVQAQGVFCSL